MEVRRAIHILLIVFGCVMALSFAYGGYLMRTGRVSSELAAAESADQPVEQWIETAELHLQEEQVEQALMAYRKALTLAPDSIDAQLGVARGEFMAGRELVASQEYERVLQLDNRNTTALLQVARIYAQQRQTWPRSEQRFKEYLQVTPGDDAARLQLARVLAWLRKDVEAVNIFSSDGVASRMTSQDERDYAFALVRAGRTTEAETQLKKLIASNNGDFELREQLASLYASRREWDSALPLYESLLAERPDHAQINLTYGLGLLSMKRYQAALTPLRRARVLIPESGEAGLAYSRALKGSGELQEAVREFDRVLPQYRNNAYILREHADLLVERRDFRRAEQSYKDALKLQLSDTPLLVGLAGALRANGKHREALPYIEEAYRRQPTNRLAFELASTLQKVGRNKEALDLLTRIENGSRPGGN